VKPAVGKIRSTVVAGFLLAMSAGGQSVPPGAAALGYTMCVINEHPTAADIAPGTNGNYKWFDGQWWETPPATTNYSTVSNALVLSLGGDLVSTPRDFSTGALPTLPGTNGFYVEFDEQLSDNNPDHWPAVWLMPVEHNAQQKDVYPGDPPGYERWMELDVDEGGWGPGLLGTVHSWTGIWPNYSSIFNPNDRSSIPLDRSKKHTFGASYNPTNQTVAWWVDGVYQMSATAPYVPAVADEQHFYLILSAQSITNNIPYTMTVSGVRAYLPMVNPTITSWTAATNRFTIRWNAEAAERYQVQCSSNLSGNNWTNVSSPVIPTTSEGFFTNAPPTNAAQYYRVELLLPGN
jgi:hypothetical protein